MFTDPDREKYLSTMMTETIGTVVIAAAHGFPTLPTFSK
jgi:hypothetical protein